MRKILMPEIGNPPGSLTLRAWLKAAGDSVAKGELLAVVEGQEGLIEVEASDGGVLSRILIPAGKSAAAGTPIAEMENASDSAPQMKQERPAMSNPGSAGKVVPILMPQVGNSMEEGTITKWMVKEGDRIAQGQVIFEIETDKANMEIEATDAGRVAKIVAAEGATIPVKQPVAYLAEEGVAIEEAPPADQPTRTQAPAETVAAPIQAPAASAAVAVVSESGRIMASPAARRLASEKGIDLSLVPGGSGPGGRILSTDLANVSVAVVKPAPATPVVSVAAAPAAKPAVSPAPVAPAAPRGPAIIGGVRKKMSKMRKAIAANLSLSKQTVPHFYLRGTINAEPMMSFYRAEKMKYPCSVNDVVTLACARTIMEFPAFRSKIDGDEIVEFPNANVGIAVGVEDGLTVPVLIGAQSMNLQQVAANTKRIAENARSGKLEGWGEGNFTITNLGMFGVEEFAAIVNPPEPAILAVGAVRDAVIVKEGFMKAGKVMTMTLSCDHRIVDGLLAAKFMARLKELLENPTVLV